MPSRDRRGRESNAVAQVADEIKHHGRRAFFWKGGASNIGFAGLPDFVGCYRGIFVGIEVKPPGRENTLRPRQKIIRDRIEAAGGVWILATGRDDVKKLFERLDNQLDSPLDD